MCSSRVINVQQSYDKCFTAAAGGPACPLGVCTVRALPEPRLPLTHPARAAAAAAAVGEPACPVRALHAAAHLHDGRARLLAQDVLPEGGHVRADCAAAAHHGRSRVRRLLLRHLERAQRVAGGRHPTALLRHWSVTAARWF